MVRLEGRGLGIGYDEPVVHELDIEIASGELVCLIGPNGAGKSTLLHGLAGLLRLHGGQVVMDGQELRKMGARERARSIALLPQSPRVPEGVSVQHFVESGRYAHRGFLHGDPEGGAVVALALDEAGLAAKAEVTLAELSGGQVQRALFARARAQDPKILLVDEPTSALDPKSQLWVLDRVADLVAEDRAALVVTHELNLASQYAHRVLLMNQGRIVAEGDPNEVLTREHLEPLYGADLLMGRVLAPRVGEQRPWIIPWSGAGERR